MKIKYLLMAAFILPCAMFTACGGDDSNDDKKPVEQPTNTDESEKIINVKVDIPIDENFKADASYIQKEWSGEYMGWDAVQKKNTTIRRKLVLNPNGTYTNIIAGKLLNTDKTQFFKFESEGGTYTYNASTGYVTYKVDYDSILTYKDQSYTRYPKKHYYAKEEANYTEKAEFSEMKEGKRVWITKDTYLQSLTAEVLDLAFSMSEFAGDNQKDQNK